MEQVNHFNRRDHTSLHNMKADFFFFFFEMTCEFLVLMSRACCSSLLLFSARLGLPLQFDTVQGLLILGLLGLVGGGKVGH